MSHQTPAVNQPQIHLEQVPEALRPSLALHWQNFCERAEAALPHDEILLASLAKVWACSEFVARACVQHPTMLLELVESGALRRAYVEDEYRQRLRERLSEVENDEQLGIALRRFRRREMVRLAWRDLAGWADLDETLRELSALACACVDEALNCLYPWQVKESGQPIGAESGEPQKLVVLGMGKLGADELNYSSDIDLIFAYPEEGETQGDGRSISNGEFFIRLGRRLIAAINQQTAEGFVFRVDMRLRPFGDAGPLAAGFDALENYYQSHGRDWERYAMIKANVIAGDREAGAELMQTLQPFVYRRYIDYGAFESLREMKGMISQQVKRKGMEENIKLGAGGIREIEFTGQAYQLIRGGRDRDLRVRPILKVLTELAAKGILPEFVEQAMREAYIFLRRAENRLQAIADQQTHTLPKNDIDRQRLAYAMDFDDYAAFHAELMYHMNTVHEHFEQIAVAPQREQAAEQGSVYDGVWDGSLDDQQSVARLGELGFDDPADSVGRLRQLRTRPRYIGMTPKGRDRMDRLMPLLLGAVTSAGHPSATLARIIELLEAVVRRTAYIALLVENPLALSQLVKLCDASPWIASHLRRYPILLDELLDPRTLYMPLNWADLEASLRIAMERAGDDLEQQMDAMRHFKQTHVLRVAAADVSGVYPLMVVSDHLTELAELEVKTAMDVAYKHLVEKHGRPQCPRDGTAYEPGFIVIAYGKMGGIELGYGSDLDLVFVHGNYNCGGHTDGAKPVDNVQFFARLGQRIIHILTAHTPAGVLYEVDSRLRPDGEKGLLVTSMQGFAKYQEKDAWTWEHQALVRARVVAGSHSLAKRFSVVRRRALCRERDPAALQKEVREMRHRMRENLVKTGVDRFDLKQGEGGIADIEFIVQYAVLRWAREYPELLTWSDNFRQIETLAAEGLMSDIDARWLTQAYQAYRAAAHRLTLNGESAQVSGEEFEEYRREVSRIWREFMEVPV